MKRTIFCDLDNTLCNLLATLVTLTNRDFGTCLTEKDVLSYPWLQEQVSPIVSNYWDKPGTYQHVEIYPHSQWFIDCLKEDYDVRIISTAKDAVHDEKGDFILKHFNVRENEIIFAHDKWKFMGPEDIIIDDYLMQIQNHVHYNNGTAILFNHEEGTPWANYSDKGVRTDKHLYATSYHRVLQILKGLK